LARAHGYGLQFAEYVASANDRILVVIQAEHRDAVENIEALVKVPGVDCVFVGPYDLSASLGRPGEIQHPEVIAAIERIELVCKAAKMPLGIFGLTAESVKPYIDRGFSLLTVGTDSVMLTTAAKKLLAGLRPN
jgi:2-keto-3-deoxy-L-rhamnonate aldolase RhmA